MLTCYVSASDDYSLNTGRWCK